MTGVIENIIDNCARGKSGFRDLLFSPYGIHRNPLFPLVIMCC